MGLYFGNLILEVTRKCNMSCPHCLRGPAQRIDMAPEIINEVTTATDWIASLSISGGEPSLGGKAIDHLRWAMYFYKCRLDSFWLTVNARFFKQDFYKALWNLYGVCEEQDECCLTISGDQYHSKPSGNALRQYSELPFFSDEWMGNIDDHLLLNEGKAKKNQMGYREVNIPIRITDYDLNEDRLYVGDTIYINAVGDVLLSCDLSYLHQKKHSLGNVLREPLQDILLRNLEPERSAAPA